MLENRCQLKEKEIHVEELKERLNELIGLLQRSEARRREMEKEQKLSEHTVAIAVATSSPVSSSQTGTRNNIKVYFVWKDKTSQTKPNEV